MKVSEGNLDPTQNVLNIPDGSTEIGANSYQESNLTEVIMPDSIICVKNEAFRASQSLKNCGDPQFGKTGDECALLDQ